MHWASSRVGGVCLEGKAEILVRHPWSTSGRKLHAGATVTCLVVPAVCEQPAEGENLAGEHRKVAALCGSPALEPALPYAGLKRRRAAGPRAASTARRAARKEALAV